MCVVCGVWGGVFGGLGLGLEIGWWGEGLLTGLMDLWTYLERQGIRQSKRPRTPSQRAGAPAI